MKRITTTVCILLVLVSLIVVPMRNVTAQGNQTSFSGTKWITYLVPGTYTYPGGNIHLRGQYMKFRIASEETRVAGVEAIVANANWDAEGTGPVWGSFTLEVAPESYWEGIFQGKMTPDGLFLHQVGVGKGDLKGLTMRAEIYLDGSTLTGTIEGVLVEHGN